VLPLSARDYGLLHSLVVSAESLIHLAGNRYSVPVAQVGTTVTVRVTRDQVHIFHNTGEIASHRRAPDGAGQRIIEPEHFRPLFTKKPRAQVMLCRQALLELSPEAAWYIGEVSYRRRERLREEILATYALLMLYGREALVGAMAQAEGRGICGAEYLEVLLAAIQTDSRQHPRLPIDLPAQETVDRRLEQYEAFVTVSTRGAAW
jgi:Mu transposase-like protein